MHGLRDIRVVDFSTEIAGPYSTKLLCDAGADVIKVEAPGYGDPLRYWSATGADLHGEDGALFRFLNHGKRSVVGRPDSDGVQDLIAGADLVVESFVEPALDAPLLLARNPGLVILSITPFGRGGPWSARPASEFTVQAESGSIGTRGLPGGEPFQAGGRIGDWVGGTFASVGALAAVQCARRTGRSEHVDFSLLEVMNIAGSNYSNLLAHLVGSDFAGFPQSVETPSIEPTADGYVGFCTNTRQQFSDFLLLIERPDLRDDESLVQVAARFARLDEWNAIVHAYTEKHTTAEIIEAASRLRIPVAPINNGETVREHPQLAERGVFVPDPTGRFEQPRPPYRIDGADPPLPLPAPRLGADTGRIEPRTRNVPTPRGEPGLPLEGLRVIDMTAWWAGPSATHMLATLGADVIHLESTGRLDGMRMVGGMFTHKFDDWWEASHFYLAANANKRSLTLDLTDERGLSLLKRLITKSDALVENFTPRVLDGFGLDWESIHQLNPRILLVRMPAFGLSGPWRDNTGFAQTMEQMTGLAWLTGHADDPPRIQRGPCDPLAGMHAALALLVGLQEREHTGRGVEIEATMVEGALNAAAEQILEHSAYGNLMQREGNRAAHAAPQGLYRCRSDDELSWLALSVSSDEQWEALVELLGGPDWSRDPELQTLTGRRAAHDRIDAELRPWFEDRELGNAVDTLLAAGIPAARVANPYTARNPQLEARGFYEVCTHPVVGDHPLPTVPFRYRSVERWLRRPAPTLGQHNREILQDLLDLSESELTELEADGVIGTRPRA